MRKISVQNFCIFYLGMFCANELMIPNRERPKQGQFVEIRHYNIIISDYIFIFSSFSS